MSTTQECDFFFRSPGRPRRNEKTTTSHWNNVYTAEPRMRFPSPLNVGILNLQRLLKRYVSPGSTLLEIGCAPGKMLAWSSRVLGASVSGLDYSPPGVAFTKKLLDTLDVSADVRCEDVFQNTFAPGSFDIVYSGGVIEHFEDPREVVAKHFDLVAPGGVGLILIPNYGGLFGQWQGRLDPANLAIHNTGIMNELALAELAPSECASVKTYPWGRFSPWILNFANVVPAKIALGASLIGNVAGLMQPMDVRALSPLLALEMRRGA